MHKSSWSLAGPLFGIAAALILSGSPAQSQLQFFHDRASFIAALSGPSTTDDFESYDLGDIALADRRGDFLYSSNPDITQPAIVPGGNGGQALGGSPFDVFVGDNSVVLDYLPLDPDQGPRLRAFGADILYAPSFEAIPASIYRLVVGDGAHAEEFIGNMDDLDPFGGTFFLGVLLNAADLNGAQSFTRVRIESVAPTGRVGDPTFLVPAYQADDLIYTAVPEPGALSFLAAGSLLFLIRSRRRM